MRFVSNWVYALHIPWMSVVHAQQADADDNKTDVEQCLGIVICETVVNFLFPFALERFL